MTEASLDRRLQEVNSDLCALLPTPQLAVLRRAVERLRRSGICERALQPGETAPDFSFIDEEDRPVTLYSLCAAGPVVINFFRGFWCPFCSSEVAAYEEHITEIAALGASYLTVSPHIRQERADTPYPSVCDCDGEIARGFGVLYEIGEEERELLAAWDLPLDRVNRSGRWELPLPALYIVGPDRTVLFRYVDVDYRHRLTPEDLLLQLGQVKDAPAANA